MDTEFSFRRIALPAYGPTIVATAGHGAILPVIALHARDLGATVGQAALVVALVSIGQLVMSLPAGALVGRIGERRALTLAGVVEAVIFVLAWQTRDLVAFAVLVLLTGMAWTVFLLARQGFLIDATPAAYRARAMSTLGGSHRIGLLVGPLLGAALIAAWGIAAVFALGAVTSLVAVAMVQSMPDLSAHARSERVSVASVLREHRRTLLTFGSAVLVISASRALRLALLPLWCDHIGMSAASISLLFGIAAAVDVSLFYPAGWVMDHYGRALVAFPVVASVALGSLLLPLTTGFASVLAVAVLIAVGNGLGSGIVMTTGADCAPTVGRAQFLGGWRLMGDVGGTAAPVALGVLAAALPLGTACVVLGLVFAGGTAWVTKWTRELDRARLAGEGAVGR
ncbi:MFS transporter [Nocardioides gansuensis]|uniref:MFS transporter n=1 Tax=Nocardioides gansuensis TaxID=2138300 RepID=A0A2T8FFC5_9ACTN|nr:MFS transporter [Nocardioides gansuensis]PVG84390.1 MFS transporter [Nocardioides gansuensis]